jgi:hypothetical protein
MHKSLLTLVAGLLFCGAACASPGSELARRDYDRGNYDVALEKAQALAESGDSGAEMLLGLMYAEGKGVAKDDGQAWQWYWKAAVAGDTRAQLALVAIYREGRGVAADADLSNYWQWKVAVGLEQSEKNKLEGEIARDATASRKNKDAGSILNQGSCKLPDYQKTGYGYHATGELQIAFMLSADGSVLEASAPKNSNWAKLDHDILNSYAKSCTFVAAKRDTKSVSSLYVLPVTWSVEP